MTPGSDNSTDPASAVWTTDESAGTSAFDEECSPTRMCRNAREFSFEGIAADGGDLKAAWRDRLEREGKFDASGGSLRDLVFGQGSSD